MRRVVLCATVWLSCCSTAPGSRTPSLPPASRSTNSLNDCAATHPGRAEMLAAATPVQNLSEALANLKIALDRCYLTRDEFFSKDVLEAYVGGDILANMSSAEFAFVRSRLGIGFEISRIRTTDGGLGSGINIMADTLTQGLRFDDVQRVFGTTYESKDFYSDSSYTHGEGAPVPPVTDRMGNKVLTFEFGRGALVKSTVFVRFSGDGIVQTVTLRQTRS